MAKPFPDYCINSEDVSAQHKAADPHVFEEPDLKFQTNLEIKVKFVVLLTDEVTNVVADALVTDFDPMHVNV